MSDVWFNKKELNTTQDNSRMVQIISEWYDNHESVVSPATLRVWDNLNTVSMDMAARLKYKYNVQTEIVSGQPYNTEEEMFRDIRGGSLLISKENVDHPIMTPNDTYLGRIWHDLTHYECKSNFGFDGEYATYRAQCRHAEEFHPSVAVDIRYSLYLDIVCQVASGMVYKQFPVQKTFVPFITKGALCDFLKA